MVNKRFELFAEGRAFLVFTTVGHSVSAQHTWCVFDREGTSRLVSWAPLAHARVRGEVGWFLWGGGTGRNIAFVFERLGAEQIPAAWPEHMRVAALEGRLLGVQTMRNNNFSPRPLAYVTHRLPCERRGRVRTVGGSNTVLTDSHARTRCVIGGTTDCAPRSST